MRELTYTDVLVVGGGPAGIGAALGAARQGAKALLIENHGFFGGIAAFTVGMCMNQMRPNGEPRSAVHELLIEKLAAYGSKAYQFRTESLLQHALFTNVEYLKVAVIDALDAVGCRYLVHTPAVEALTEGDRVTGVVVSTKDGLAAIRADCVVDCTGDCDVAHFAGAETQKDAVGSPMTLCFNVTHVDMAATYRFPPDGTDVDEVARQAQAKYPLIPPRWALGRFPSSTCFYINHAGTRVLGPLDGTDPEQLTRAECLSHRQVLQMVDAMREFGGEALKDIEIVTSGPQIGIRETRRILGEHVLTEEEALNGAHFDDGVAWRSGVLDIGFVRTQPMPTHDVPYRALLPVKVDGLLAAGKCISTEHAAHSAGKSMGNCIATGHAAGVAAAMSSAAGCLPRALDVDALRAALRADGVNLDLAGSVPNISDEASQHFREGENWNRTQD